MADEQAQDVARGLFRALAFGCHGGGFAAQVATAEPSRLAIAC
jgi:hypothetical protein